MSVTVAHGLFLWQEDRPTLEACLRSVTPWVDRTIVAEGRIDGVPDLGLGDHSDLRWLADPSDFLPERIEISSHGAWPGQAPWPTLSAACTWILQTAARHGVDWLLYIDADQELHNGHHLKEVLGYATADTFPIRRAEPTGIQMECPWQLIRVAAFTRYLAGCYIVETTGGKKRNLVPDSLDPHHFHHPGFPWISHHPERRPPWRRQQRLGEFETLLEPPNAVVSPA